MTDRRYRAIVLSLSGVTGVFLAHNFAYMLAMPGGSERHRRLADTGHGYMHHLGMLAITAAAVAIATTFARGARSTRRTPRRRTQRPISAAGLLVWQLALFAFMEHTERIAAGAPVAGLWREREIIIGVALQVVVAATISAVLAFVHRAGEAAGAWRKRNVPRSIRPASIIWSEAVRRNHLPSTVRGRAPPALRSA